MSAAGWELAGTVLAISDRTRRICQDALTEKVRESNAARGQLEGERAVLVEEQVAEAAIKRVCSNVLRALEGRGWRGHAELRKGQTSTDRGYFDAAIERLAGAAQVEVDEAGRGTRYRRV